jgi:hypothetical protein
LVPTTKWITTTTKNPIFGLVKMKQGTSRKMVTNNKNKKKNQLMNNTTSNKAMSIFN